MGFLGSRKSLKKNKNGPELPGNELSENVFKNSV
jgi:hypothetical protein